MEPMTVVDFPDRLRNDVFYCQRALKEHIKIHQFCAVQQALKPRPHYARVIQSIENEIQGIARDQRKVIAMMKAHLKGISKKVDLLNHSEEYDNNIIRSYLEMHRPSMQGLVLQASGIIRSRATEKQLIKQFELLPDLQQFMRPKDVIERNSYPQSPLKAGGSKHANGAANQLNPNLVSESRRKFMAALQCAKRQPQVPQHNLDDSEEEDVEFLASKALFREEGVDGYLQARPMKKIRGRPKKGKQFNNPNGSAPSTRPNSPEAVVMPYVYLPPEPEESNDYDQEGFLIKFGLYTLEMAHKLKTRRPERRKRTVQSTEKTDFHYGQIDSAAWLKDRNASLGRNKKAPQQYLSPKTFKKRRTFDRSSSSSPPTEASPFCACKFHRTGDGPTVCSKCGRKAT